MKLPRFRLELIGLTVASILTHFWDLFTPKSVVFDEVYFKVFAGHYLDHRYFFDIHPPLVKLLFAGWAYILDIPASGLTNTGDPSVALRVLPALAGTLLIPLFWHLLRQLGARRPFAFIGALALLCDNALLVESRFVLMDSLLLLFGIASLSLYLSYRSRTEFSRWIWLFFAALMAGAAASTKWTGLTALGIIGLLFIRDSIVKLHTHVIVWRERLISFLIIIIIPVALYVGAFAVHFALLPHSGDGDAFMSPKFQSTLIGNPAYNPHVKMSFLSKFIELNHEMYVANQTLTATHPYGSRWYTWPLELRPIYYWEGSTLSNGQQGNIYLLGNPIVWWGTVGMIILGLIIVWYRRLKLRAKTAAALGLLAVAYLANYLPFVGVTRVMFLYHYFFAFVFSVAFAVILWNDITTHRDGSGEQLVSNKSFAIYLAACAAICLGFVWFAPISYGTPLTPAGLQARMWLTSWR